MDLLANPFCVLGATTRHNRRQLMDLAEERSLHDEGEKWREASATLANPRRRLAAEIGWLIGVGPRNISELLRGLQQNPELSINHDHLPPLAAVNLLSAGFSRAIRAMETDSIAEWIVELGQVFDDVDPESVLDLVNSDRVVAGIPEITDRRLIESELAERRVHLRRALREALNSLPAAQIVEVMTSTVNVATDHGTEHAPVLIEDLVDLFEVEAQGFLDRETTNIRELIEQTRSALESGQDRAGVASLLAQLDKVTRNWDHIAQPIQMLARSRGLDHDLSRQVAAAIRSLAVEAFNEHGQLEVSQQLTKLQQEVFSELDSVAEQTAEDEAALSEIAEQRVQMIQEAKAHAEQWRREITYQVEWGLLFKSRFQISPDGIDWSGRRWPLESIERLRWGATKHYTNGIYTGTNYMIFFGTGASGARVEPKKEAVFSEIIERLWRAIGVRLMTEMLEGLRDGKRYRFGSALFDDLGVELEKSRLFAANDKIRCRWTDLVIGNRPGSFYIARKNQEDVSVELSYQEHDNVHILEAAMRAFWKNAGERFSSLLTSG